MMKALIVIRINYKSIVCPLRPWNYVQILHFVKRSKVCILYSINIVPWQIPANKILLKCSTYLKSHRIVRHSIVLHCTGSHRIASIALSFITWHQIVLQWIVQHCIISYIIALHCIAVNHIGSHCITSIIYRVARELSYILLHQMALRSSISHLTSYCTGPHCNIALHCIASHLLRSKCTAFHYIARHIIS